MHYVNRTGKNMPADGISLPNMRVQLLRHRVSIALILSFLSLSMDFCDILIPNHIEINFETNKK